MALGGSLLFTPLPPYLGSPLREGVRGKVLGVMIDIRHILHMNGQRLRQVHNRATSSAPRAAEGRPKRRFQGLPTTHCVVGPHARVVRTVVMALVVLARCGCPAELDGRVQLPPHLLNERPVPALDAYQHILLSPLHIDLQQ